jgi:hypothetical protein
MQQYTEWITKCQLNKHIFLILSLLSRIKILTNSRNYQQHEEHSRNPNFTRIKIKPNWSKFIEVLRDSSLNHHHRTIGAAIQAQIPRICTITVRRGEKERDRSRITSKKKKKRITDLFSVQELTRSIRKDLLFESPYKIQVYSKNLLVLAYNHHRRSINKSKRWNNVD